LTKPIKIKIMKKIVLILALLITSIGYSQTPTGVKRVTVTSPTAITVTGIPVVEPATGFGRANGSINIVFTGGTGAYTYIWTKNGLEFTDAISSGPTSWNNLGAGNYTIIASRGGCSSAPYSFEIFEPAELKVTINTTVIACYGGAETLTASTVGGFPYGGTPNYTYNWYTCDDIIGTNSIEISVNNTSNAISNKIAGFYKVVVSDGKNSASNIEELIQNTVINATPTKTDVKCNGGNDGVISLVVSGGTNPVVTWKDSNNNIVSDLSHLKADTYSYTITDGLGCTFNNGFATEVKIDELTVLEVTATQTQPNGTASDGTITAIPTGGTTPNYHYVWTKIGDASFSRPDTNFISGLPNGTYQVTVTDDNSCSPPTATKIVTLEALAVKIDKIKNTNCTIQGSATLQATATGGTINLGSDYTYQWYKDNSPYSTTNVINDLSSGSYKVTVTDSNSVSVTSEIINITTLSITNPSKIDLVCKDGINGSASISVIGGTSSYTYTWDKSGTVDNTATTPTYSNLTAGTYNVTVNDGFSCPVTQKFIINEPTKVTINDAIPVDATGFGLKGSVSVTVKDGTPYTAPSAPYTYQWYTGQGATKTEFTGETSATLIAVANTYTIIATDSKGCTAEKVFTINEPAELLVAFSGDATLTTTYNSGTKIYSGLLNCSGGSGTLKATPSGGFPYSATPITRMYDYSWAITYLDGTTASSIDAFVIAKAGTYTLTINDKASPQNTKTETIIVSQPIVLTVNDTTPIDATGFGLKGSITVTAKDGTPYTAPSATYTYQWYIGQGTTKTKFTGETSAVLNAVANTYTVIATDAKGCISADKVFTINEPAELKVVFSGDTTLTITSPTTGLLDCFDGTGIVTATPSGGLTNATGYSYSWAITYLDGTTASSTNSFVTAKAGTYTVTIKDNASPQNTKIETIIVSQPTAIQVVEATVGVKKMLNCFGESDGIVSVNVSGGTPFVTGATYKYFWKKFNKSNSTYEPIGTDSPTQTGLSAGTYAVEVRDANYKPSNTASCVGVLNGIIIEQPLKLAFTYTTTDVTCKVLPNTLPDGSIQLTITGGTVQNDVNGKPIYKISCDSPTASIDIANQKITNLSAGKWQVTVTDDKSCAIPAQEIEIKEPNAAVAFDTNIIPTPTTGFGRSDGSIALNIVGGWGTYSYKWYTGIGTISTNLILNENGATLSNKPAGKYTAEATDKNKDGLGCTITATFEIKQPSEPTLALAKTEAKCNGLLGSIQATATGGFPYSDLPITRTYTYKLYKSTDLTTAIASQYGSTADFTGLQTGDYTVIATDTENYSTKAETIALFQPTPIVVTLNSKSPVLCFGENQGAISVNVIGGTPYTTNTGATFYNYVWKKYNVAKNIYEAVLPNTNSASINNLYAGTYSVEVQDANYDTNPAICVGILNDIILVAPVDLNFNYDKLKNSKPTSAIATDGSIHIEMIGGQQSYTYRCTRGTETGPEVFVKTTTDLSVDILNLNRDHYFITVTDNTGCPKKIDYDFNSTTNLTVSLQTPIAILCKNYTTTLNSVVSGGIGGNQYSWFKNGVKIDGATNPTLTNAGAGKYYVVVINADKKEETSNEITVSEPLQVEFTTAHEPVKCKGESNGTITLTALGGNGKFQYRYFYQNTGTGIFTPFTNANTTTITGLLAGEYTIEVQDTNTCASMSKKETVTQPAEAIAIATTTKTPILRFGSNEASITVTPQGGNGGYTYEWFRKDNSKINQFTATANGLFAGWYYVIVKDAKGCSVTSSLIEVIQPPLLVASVAMQNSILCQGSATASIKASATGGFLKPGENYTYKWFAYGTIQPVLGTNAILENLKAGDSYYVVATDSNKINALSGKITITEPTAIDNFLTADYTLCGDGKDWTIATHPTEGTPPYTYIWNTGETTPSINVVAGTYNVTVSDKNGCSINKEIVLVIPAHLDASTVIKKPTCFEGNDATITVTTIDGTAPFKYLWNTGETSNILSNAVAKAYSVDITDARGCVITRNYTIENPPKDVINIGDDVTLCKGQSLTINATIKDDKAIYAWTADNGFVSDKPIITVTKPGIYALTVTNNLGCQATDSIKIESDNIDIGAEFAVSSQVFVNEKFIIVDISNPQPDSLEWVLPLDANVKEKNKDFVEMSFSKAGEYELTLNTKRGNCTAFQSKKILVVEGNYVDPELDAKTVFDLKIYPNPSDGVFTIDAKLESVMPVKIKLYNLTNNAIIDAKTDEGKSEYSFSFNLNGLASGVYYVLFESKQGNKLRKIIIK
jgi:Secretion system C-terminal sorting domain/SprB repeat